MNAHDALDGSGHVPLPHPAAALGHNAQADEGYGREIFPLSTLRERPHEPAPMTPAGVARYAAAESTFVHRTVPA